MTMQFVTSIRNIYRWFLSGIGKESLNSYYHILTYSKIPLGKFAKITISLALSLVKETEKKLPVLLLIDDTLQEKFGTKFECYKKLFDHARHNGSNYMNGHCFVALTICVPVAIGTELRYLNIPLRFRLRGENDNKLTMASEMIRDAMKELQNVETVILLCDSWYPKGDVLETVASCNNLELIANVRVDTAAFDLPPERTGKRGRPAKTGKKLSIYTDFSFSQVGEFFIAAKTVLTNLFDSTVYMTVTTPNIDNHDAYRLFLSTVMPESLAVLFANHHALLKRDSPQDWLFPLYLYSFRWSIEVMFYELKTFWSFGYYMLRSKHGIENFINIISIVYAAVHVLPLTDSAFASLADFSSLSAKSAIAQAVQRDLILSLFAENNRNILNSFDLINSLALLELFPKGA